MKHTFTAAAAAAALLFGADSAFAADIPVQKLDPALNAQLPQAIKDAGVIRNCVIGSFSPYTITRTDKTIEGAAMDLTKALGEVLGVKIETTKIAGHSATMLNAQLPQAIKDAGVIRNCVIGSFSPYTITRTDKTIEGAAMDLTKALGEVLGVKIETTKIAGHSATMLGLKSGRYDVSL